MTRERYPDDTVMKAYDVGSKAALTASRKISRRSISPGCFPLCALSPPDGHFLPRCVGDIEYVHRLLAEGCDMGRGDVEAEVAQATRQIEERPGRSSACTSMTVCSCEAELSMTTSGGTVNAPIRALALLARTFCGSSARTPETTSPITRANFSVCVDFFGVVGIGAVEIKRVERQPVARRVDLRRGDIRASGRAGARALREQSRMVRRDKGQLRDRMAQIAAADIGKRAARLAFEAPNQVRVLNLALGLRSSTNNRARDAR